MSNQTPSLLGKIVTARGSVVDVHLESHLPPIHSLLHTRKDDKIVIGASAQLNASTERRITLTATPSAGLGSENGNQPY